MPEPRMRFFTHRINSAWIVSTQEEVAQAIAAFDNNGVDRYITMAFRDDRAIAEVMVRVHEQLLICAIFARDDTPRARFFGMYYSLETKCWTNGNHFTDCSDGQLFMNLPVDEQLELLGK